MLKKAGVQRSIVALEGETVLIEIPRAVRDLSPLAAVGAQPAWNDGYAVAVGASRRHA